MEVSISVIFGILIPFIGTSIGAAFVFFMKKQLGRSVQRALTGFAAGVMTAASVWSLLIPAIDQSETMGVFAFVPAFIGFWIGTLFLLVLDKTIPHLHMFADKAEGHKSNLARTTTFLKNTSVNFLTELPPFNGFYLRSHRTPHFDMKSRLRRFVAVCGAKLKAMETTQIVSIAFTLAVYFLTF